MPNPGPASTPRSWQSERADSRELDRAGADGAYPLVCGSGRRASLDPLYAIGGAIGGRYWREVKHPELRMYPVCGQQSVAAELNDGGAG